MAHSPRRTALARTVNKNHLCVCGKHLLLTVSSANLFQPESESTINLQNQVEIHAEVEAENEPNLQKWNWFLTFHAVFALRNEKKAQYRQTKHSAQMHTTFKRTES